MVQISPETETLLRELRLVANAGDVPPRGHTSLAKRAADEIERLCGLAPSPDLWRPMDTVPRDGSKIMLTGVTAGGHRWFMDGEVYAKGWIGGSAVNRVPNYWRPIPKDFALPASPDTSTDREGK
jgi:hypothetical protein